MTPNRASLTAVKVGRVILYLAHHERLAAVLPEGCGAWTERLMFAAGSAKPWMIRLFKHAAWRSTIRAIEDRTVPGQALAFGLRKAFVDAEVQDALRLGARQVLVVGAGLDVLCARLAPKWPEVRFVEIDHPATHGLKAEALQKAGGMAPNLSLIAADLAVRPLAEVLDESGWDATPPSVAVAEGLLMYLPDEAVRGLFGALRSRMGPGSRVVFTWLTRDEAGQIEVGRSPALFAHALALVGEPLRWGARPAELGPLLAEQGWRLVEDPARTDLHARFLVPLGLGDELAGGVERAGVAASE